MEISVPSALCLLESNVFLFLVAVFWQMGRCFFCGPKKEIQQLYLETGKFPASTNYIVIVMCKGGRKEYY